MTTAKKTPGVVCILFVFLYELYLIDESVRTSKNYKFFIFLHTNGVSSILFGDGLTALSGMAGGDVLCGPAG